MLIIAVELSDITNCSAKPAIFSSV